MRHFCSRNAFDIEGLGDRQIAFFYEKGLIRTAADIFTLQARDSQSLTRIENFEGFGKVSTRKLFDGHRGAARDRAEPVHLRARHPPCRRDQRHRAGAGSFETFEALREAAREAPESEARKGSSIDGIGDVVAEAVADFFLEQHNEQALDALLAQVRIVPMEAVKSDSPVRARPWSLPAPCKK